MDVSHLYMAYNSPCDQLLSGMVVLLPHSYATIIP